MPLIKRANKKPDVKFIKLKPINLKEGTPAFGVMDNNFQVIDEVDGVSGIYKSLKIVSKEKDWKKFELIYITIQDIEEPHVFYVVQWGYGPLSKLTNKILNVNPGTNIEITLYRTKSWGYNFNVKVNWENVADKVVPTNWKDDIAIDEFRVNLKKEIKKVSKELEEEKAKRREEWKNSQHSQFSGKKENKEGEKENKEEVKEEIPEKDIVGAKDEIPF